MIRRCHDPRDSGYARHGGAGVKVCERWRARGGFEAFKADVGERPGREYSLRRIDESKGYEPGNCDWVARKAEAKDE